MNIIFLDVDGILNSNTYFKFLYDSESQLRSREIYNDISDFHLQMLAKIYHTCNAKIVLSSTWRELDNKDKIYYSMYQYLLDSLAKYDMKIIDKTPVIDMNRPLEIVTWINNQVDKDDIKFVSLDDDFGKEDYDKYGIGNCLVKTNFFGENISEVGLQQRHVNKAIKILNGE